MSYSTVHGRIRTGVVTADVKANGTIRAAQVVRKLKGDVYGFKALSGDASVMEGRKNTADAYADLCQVGIVWMPGKSVEQVSASANKYVLGYYTPRL